MFCVKYANRRHRPSAIYLQKKLFESKNFTITSENNYIGPSK